MRYGVFLAGILLAGCLAGSPNVQDTPEENIQWSSLRLSGCTGGGARLEAPGYIQAPVPPGWDGNELVPVTVALFVVFCDHVSIGPFERGPVEAVFESHAKFAAPLNCREGDYTFLNVLSRVIWSDAEIATLVEQKLGIPSSFGNITRQQVGADALHMTTLTWSIGSNKSAIDLGYAQNQVLGVDRIYRYVWQAGENLGLIDFSWSARQTWVEPTAAFGSFSNPMLIASTNVPVVFGVGAQDEEFLPAGGDLRLFEGYECAKELSF